MKVAARLLALSFGGLLVVTAVSYHANQIMQWDSRSSLAWLSALPSVLVAFFFAWVMWRYASMQNDIDETGETGFLKVGIKLIGIYLIATSLPSILALSTVISMISSGKIDADVFQYVAEIVGQITSLVLGIILIFATNNIRKFLEKNA